MRRTRLESQALVAGRNVRRESDQSKKPLERYGRDGSSPIAQREPASTDRACLINETPQPGRCALASVICCSFALN